MRRVLPLFLLLTFAFCSNVQAERIPSWMRRCVHNIYDDGVCDVDGLMSYDGSATFGIDVDDDGTDDFVFTTSGMTMPRVAAPCRTFGDSDTADTDDNAQICANCTTTTADIEECDVTIDSQRAGSMTTCFTIDGDGGITLGCADNASVTLTTDGTGTAEVVLPAGSVDSTEVLDATLTATDMAATLTFADAFLMDFGANVTDATEGLILPGHATDCTTATAEGQACWEEDATSVYVGDGSAAKIVGGRHVASIPVQAGAWSVDGTQCALPTEVTINSGAKLFTVICTDNAASVFDFNIPAMPDSYDGGTVTVEMQYIQTAADTNVISWDIACACRGDSDAMNSTFGTAVENSVTFTTANDIEHATTAAITCDGTCAAGDTMFFKGTMDAATTTTAVATLHMVGAKVEYTKDLSD